MNTFLSHRENLHVFLGSLFGPYEKVSTFSFRGGWRTEVNIMDSRVILKMDMGCYIGTLL